MTDDKHEHLLRTLDGAGAMHPHASEAASLIRSQSARIAELERERDEVAENYKGVPVEQAKAIIAKSGLPLFIQTRYVRTIDHNESMDRLHTRAESAERRAAEAEAKAGKLPWIVEATRLGGDRDTQIIARCQSGAQAHALCASMRDDGRYDFTYRKSASLESGDDHA